MGVFEGYALTGRSGRLLPLASWHIFGHNLRKLSLFMPVARLVYRINPGLMHLRK